MKMKALLTTMGQLIVIVATYADDAGHVYDFSTSGQRLNTLTNGSIYGHFGDLSSRRGRSTLPTSVDNHGRV